MVDTIKISIITVSYNAVRTIEQTISSVIHQTHPNIEYIIIDGGSTDGTVDVIKEYEDKIAYWISEPDHGIYDAMNKGIDVATGDYIQFLGADDCLIAPDIIEKVSRFLHEDPFIDILSGTVWMVDEKSHYQYLWRNKFDDKKILTGYMVNHQGLFTRTEILKKRKFNLQYKIVSDYDFFLHVHFKKSLKKKYLDLDIAFFSLNGVSGENSEFTEIKEREILDVLKKYNLNTSIFVNNIKRKNLLRVKLKRWMKCFMMQLGIWPVILRKKGWKLHYCKNEKCRWCGK